LLEIEQQIVGVIADLKRAEQSLARAEAREQKRQEARDDRRRTEEQRHVHGVTTALREQAQLYATMSDPKTDETLLVPLEIDGEQSHRADHNVAQGNVDVSGAVYGAAIGVNLGTVNINSLPPAPGLGNGLDELQLRLLTAIRQRTEIAPFNILHDTSVAESLGISAQELSDELEILEGEGYLAVKKYINEVRVALTPKARKLLSRARAQA